MMCKYNNLIFACIKINESSLTKTFAFAGAASQIILKSKGIPLVPILACYGNNQNKKQYEELWKAMIQKADVIFVFDEVDDEMKKQIDYAKAIGKQIFYERTERNETN